MTEIIAGVLVGALAGYAGPGVFFLRRELRRLERHVEVDHEAAFATLFALEAHHLGHDHHQAPVYVCPVDGCEMRLELHGRIPS